MNAGKQLHATLSSMIFGIGRQKKIQALLNAGNEHAEAGNFAEARKASEQAFNLAAEALGDHAAAAQQAQALMVHAALKVGDWVWAQSAAERAMKLFDERLGVGDLQTILVRRSLLHIYARRENHAAVLALVRAPLSYFSAEHTEHSILRALTAPSLAALGRIDEAVETAKGAFTDAKKHHGKDAETTAVTCRLLAKVLIETGRDPGAGFKLIELFRQKSAPRTVAELLGFLDDSCLQAQAHFNAGNLNEAAQYLDITLKAAFTPVWEVGGHPRLLYGKLEALYGEALAALGEVADAEQKVQGAIREVEASAGPRSPDLIPILESHARVLRTKNDERGAETQEKRAAAIRSLVTGKKVAPVKQLARRAVTAVWPRRTLSGVFHLRNVSTAVLTTIITSMRPVAPTDTGFETIPLPGDEAFIVMNQWEKAWDPPIAVVAKNYLAALTNIVHLINAGAAAAGGKQVVLEPWIAIRDSVSSAWEQWPSGQRERMIRDVFPTLPEWRGNGTAQRWLGNGIRLENDRPRHVAASLELSFAPSNAIALVGMAPAALLDRWFSAFARATQLYPPEMFSRLSEGPPEDAPLIAKMPMARA